MKIVTDYLRDLVQSTVRGWNWFWFSPSDVATLGAIRIMAGAMLLYTHAIWSLDLEAFLGPDGWLAQDMIGPLRTDRFAWSYLWHIQSPALLWTVHIAALVVFAMFTLGLFTRVVSVLAWLITVAYANRLTGAMFGLDQINALLAMYLMIAPSGAAYSLDRLIAARRAGGALAPAAPTIGANVSIRLIQLHMCVIYFFAGASKLMGPSWWNGEAMWMAFANLEYQSLDMTWMVKHELLINLLTHVTILWELSYCVLVWPRLTRPLVVALAIPLHMGIAICLGMITFGLAMLIANCAFVSPWLVRAIVDPLLARWRRGGAATEPASSPADRGAARGSHRPPQKQTAAR